MIGQSILAALRDELSPCTTSAQIKSPPLCVAGSIIFFFFASTCSLIPMWSFQHQSSLVPVAFNSFSIQEIWRLSFFLSLITT